MAHATLLGLPLELRLTIYDFVFEPNDDLSLKKASVIKETDFRRVRLACKQVYIELEKRNWSYDLHFYVNNVPTWLYDESCKLTSKQQQKVKALEFSSVLAFEHLYPSLHEAGFRPSVYIVHTLDDTRYQPRHDWEHMTKNGKTFNCFKHEEGVETSPLWSLDLPHLIETNPKLESLHFITPSGMGKDKDEGYDTLRDMSYLLKAAYRRWAYDVRGDIRDPALSAVVRVTNQGLSPYNLDICVVRKESRDVDLLGHMEWVERQIWKK